MCADETLHGGCHCGAVTFEIDAPFRPVVACHCSQCRAWSGHYWAATAVPLTRFRLTQRAGLAWYSASPTARRGFCRGCGASLFWKPEAEERISIAPGALAGPTGLSLAEHIFTEDAGDYYAPSGPPPAPGPERTEARLEAACMCGASRFSLPRPEGAITACHCSQCRKLSGHYAASFDCAEESLDWQASGSVSHYTTPGGGTRGFCGGCGSSLWFRARDGAFSVEAGVIRGPTGLRLAEHIYCAEQGDYYPIDDGLPQYPGP